MWDVLVLDTERRPACALDKAAVCILTDRRLGQRNSSQQCLICSKWVVQDDLEFISRCSLVTATDGRPAIQCELRTRYPAFICSKCTPLQQQRSQGLNATATAAAVVVKDEDQGTAGRQLSPDHVEAVYTLCSSDGKANLVSLTKTFTVTCPDCGQTASQLLTPQQVLDYVLNHSSSSSSSLQVTRCRTLQRRYDHGAYSTPEAYGSDSMHTSPVEAVIVQWIARILVVDALHVAHNLRTAGTAQQQQSALSICSISASAAAGFSGDRSMYLPWRAWALETLTQDTELIAAANWVRPSLAGLQLPDRHSLLDLVLAPPYTAAGGRQAGMTAHKLAVLMKSKAKELQQLRQQVSLATAAGIKKLLGDMLCDDAVFKFFAEDQRVQEFLAMAGISSLELNAALSASYVQTTHLKVCPCCGGFHKLSLTGCSYCIICSKCSYCLSQVGAEDDAHSPPAAAATTRSGRRYTAETPSTAAAAAAAVGHLCPWCECHDDAAAAAAIVGFQSSSPKQQSGNLVAPAATIAAAAATAVPQSKRNLVRKLVSKQQQQQQQQQQQTATACAARLVPASVPSQSVVAAMNNSLLKAHSGQQTVDGAAARDGGGGGSTDQAAPAAAASHEAIHSMPNLQQIPHDSTIGTAAAQSTTTTTGQPQGSNLSPAVLGSAPAAAAACNKQQRNPADQLSAGGAESSAVGSLGSNTAMQGRARHTVLGKRPGPPLEQVAGSTAGTCVGNIAANHDGGLHQHSVYQQTAGDAAKVVKALPAVAVQPSTGDVRNPNLSTVDGILDTTAAATTPVNNAAACAPCGVSSANAVQLTQPMQHSSESAAAEAAAASVKAGGSNNLSLTSYNLVRSIDAVLQLDLMSDSSPLKNSLALHAVWHFRRQYKKLMQIDPAAALAKLTVLHQFITSIKQADLLSVQKVRDRLDLALLSTVPQQSSPQAAAEGSSSGISVLELLLQCWLRECDNYTTLTAAELAAKASSGLCQLTLQVFLKAFKLPATVAAAPTTDDTNQPAPVLFNQLSMQLMEGLSLLLLSKPEDNHQNPQQLVNFQILQAQWRHSMEVCLNYLDTLPQIMEEVSSQLEDMKS